MTGKPAFRIHETHGRIAVISDLADISDLAVIGAPAEWIGRESIYPAVICAGVIVREFARVHAGCDRETIVGEDTLLMAGSHVGHDSQIGSRCHVAPNAVIGGNVTIGDDVKIGMNASIRPRITVGDGARIGAGAVVVKDVPPGVTVVGNPARPMVKS